MKNSCENHVYYSWARFFFFSKVKLRGIDHMRDLVEGSRGRNKYGERDFQQEIYAQKCMSNSIKLLISRELFVVKLGN